MLRSFRLSASITSILLLMFPVSSCIKKSPKISEIKAESTEAMGLDVNDVSILYPVTMNKIFAETKLLSMATPLSTGQQIMPEEVWNQLLEYVRNGQAQNKVAFINAADGTTQSLVPANFVLGQMSSGGKESFKILGFRVDFCAPKTTDNNADCLVQVRLIAQPFAIESTSFFVADEALHLVYTFSAEGTETEKLGAQKFIANKLTEIKKSNGPNLTTGVSLGIHPAMKEDPSGEVMKRFNTLLLELLSNQEFHPKLTELAVSALPSGATRQFPSKSNHTWTFAAFSIRSVQNTLKLIPIALEFPKTEANKKISQALIELPNSFLSAGQIFDQGPFTLGNEARPDAVGAASKKSTHEAITVGGMEKFNVALLDAIPFIENPLLSSLLPKHQLETDAIDCVSCHTSTHRSLLGLESQRQHLKKEIVNSLVTHKDRYHPKAGITGFMERNFLQKTLWDVRNFGYNGVSNISIRTLNETAEVANYANKNILNVENPSPVDCGDGNAFWTCVLESESTETDSLETTCLQKMCKNVKEKASSPPLERLNVDGDQLPGACVGSRKGFVAFLKDNVLFSFLPSQTIPAVFDPIDPNFPDEVPSQFLEFKYAILSENMESTAKCKKDSSCSTVSSKGNALVPVFLMQGKKLGNEIGAIEAGIPATDLELTRTQSEDGKTIFSGLFRSLVPLQACIFGGAG